MSVVQQAFAQDIWVSVCHNKLVPSNLGKKSFSDKLSMLASLLQILKILCVANGGGIPIPEPAIAKSNDGPVQCVVKPP